jgi:hypothetical protein
MKADNNNNNNNNSIICKDLAAFVTEKPQGFNNVASNKDLNSIINHIQINNRTFKGSQSAAICSLSFTKLGTH